MSFEWSPSLRIAVAELKKGAECVRQVGKCARAWPPYARGVGEIKVFSLEALMEMRSNGSVSSSTVDVLPLFRKTQLRELVVAVQRHLDSRRAARLAVEMLTAM